MVLKKQKRRKRPESKNISGPCYEKEETCSVPSFP
jgi:hypothetical protein